MALGFIYTFVTTVLCILIILFGVEPQHFGYYQTIIVVAFFLGSLLATELADLIVLNLGLAFTVFGAAIVVGLIYFEYLTPITLALGYAFIAPDISPVFAVAPTKTMSAIKIQ